jgi:DNA repair/transcription protein MET18/MMS19
MPDAQEYVHTFDVDKAGALQIAQRTASSRGSCSCDLPIMLTEPGLELKETNLINVIESIGDYVKDEDATIRSKALHYLSQVLASLPANFLSRQQIQVICEYLCERIEDGGAVLGLKTLQGLPRFNDEMTISTTRA